MKQKTKIIKAHLPAELVRRAEHAKVDLDLDWSGLIARSVEAFLDSRDGFSRVAAELDGVVSSSDGREE